MPKYTKTESFFGLSNTMLEVAAKKEADHSKEEKVSIKQGDVTKCGFTVKAVLKDGRLLVSDVNCAKVVNRDSVKF